MNGGVGISAAKNQERLRTIRSRVGVAKLRWCSYLEGCRGPASCQRALGRFSCLICLRVYNSKQQKDRAFRLQVDFYHNNYVSTQGYLPAVHICRCCLLPMLQATSSGFSHTPGFFFFFFSSFRSHHGHAIARSHRRQQLSLPSSHDPP